MPARAFFLLLLVPMCLAAPPFMRGLSGCKSDNVTLGLVKAAHVSHIRRYIMWRYAEPVVSTIDTTLTVPKMQADPKRYVYDWASGLSWAGMDLMVTELEQIGITPVLEVGEGTVTGQPMFNGSTLSPDAVGHELYIALQYRWARAAVARYKEHRVALYQIENELNEAFFSFFAGQRPFSWAWSNWTFLTELLTAMRQAVKDEDPTAMVTVNLHTDIPRTLHDLLKFPGYFLDAVKDWAPLLDYISFDAYPNRVVAQPSAGALLGERIQQIRKAFPPGHADKPIFVMETGYPVNAVETNHSVWQFDFSQEMQCDYINDAVRSVVAAGGAGIFYFNMNPSQGMLTPTGGYTNADAQMLAEFRTAIQTGNVSQFVSWVLASPANYVEVATRGLMYVNRPDTDEGWGLIDLSHTPRKGYFALQQAYKNLTFH